MINLREGKKTIGIHNKLSVALESSFQTLPKVPFFFWATLFEFPHKTYKWKWASPSCLLPFIALPPTVQRSLKCSVSLLKLEGHMSSFGVQKSVASYSELQSNTVKATAFTVTA